MTVGFTNTAFTQLSIPPVNIPMSDPQISMALTQVCGNISSWTLRVANALNLLIPNGGPVPVSQGGTGLTDGTSGGVPYFNSTTTMASSALLTAGEVVAGGGAGAAPVSVANGQLPATATNDSAASGKLGEYLSTIVLIANEVSINAAANVATLSLTAGDWMVEGELWVDNSTGGATLNGRTNASVTTASATTPTVPADATGRTVYDSTVLVSSTVALVLPVAPVRISLATTTNVYLVGVASISAGTAYGYGKLAARRVR